MEEFFEPGDIVLCTVDRIIGTNVFVRIPLKNKEIEGYIVTSEIAPGRIRNLRDYVVPLKKIVCKVLRAYGDRIELSLRRVTKKEQEEVKEKYSQEKSYMSIIKSILKEKSEELIEKILENSDLYTFFQESKENSKELEKIAGKENAQKILDILNAQKKKKIILKKEIFLSTSEPNGLDLIKSILNQIKDVEIKYLSSGKYAIKKESDDIKNADHEIKDALDKIEKEAKSKNVEFNILKK